MARDREAEAACEAAGPYCTCGEAGLGSLHRPDCPPDCPLHHRMPNEGPYGDVAPAAVNPHKPTWKERLARVAESAPVSDTLSEMLDAAAMRDDDSYAMHRADMFEYVLKAAFPEFAPPHHTSFYGTEGQDRKSYTDVQDRESYTVSHGDLEEEG